MNYLQKLKAEKQARESFEKDTLYLKQLITQIQEYYSVYDGDFLVKLDKFIKDYKQPK